MAQTRHKLHIFDLWPLSVTLTFDIVMGFVRDTSTQHGEHFHKVLWNKTGDTLTQHREHFHKVSWRYNNNFRSYDPDKAQITHFLSLNSKCDLDLWLGVMGLVRDMPTQHGEHFHKVSWRHNNNLWSNGPDKAQITHFLPLTSKCDLDLWHRVMGLVHDTPTQHGEHFHKVSWRYNNNLWSYGTDKS
jgi:hypothetical protein